MGRVAALPMARAVVLGALLVAADAAPVLDTYAGTLGRGRAARAAAAVPAAAPAANANALQGAQPQSRREPPEPSGAPSTVPQNPVLDGEVRPVGTPPANHDFAQAGYQVGAPPGNNTGTVQPLSAGGPTELTTDPFTVAAEAQFVGLFVRSTSADVNAQFYLDVVAADGTATTINGTDIRAPRTGASKRYAISAWQGQTVRLRVRRAYASLLVEDLGVQWVDFPSWATQGRVQSVAGGPDGTGRAARLDVTEGAASLTSAPFALPAEAQQVTLAASAETYASKVLLELLTGPEQATVVPLHTRNVPAGGAWVTAKAVVAPWAGQTVRLRVVRQGQPVLVDDVAVAEAILPGWTPRGSGDPIAVGADAAGSWVGVEPERGGAITLESSPVSTAIADVPGRIDARYYLVRYDIGLETASLIRVYWFSAVHPTGVQVYSDAANTPTGLKAAWVRIDDRAGATGSFRINVDGGRVYDFGPNLAAWAWADPCTHKVADPIDTATGIFGQTVTDLTAGGGPLPLAFARTYVVGRDAGGTMGWGWRHGYDLRVEPVGADARVVWPAGNEEWFAVSGGVGRPLDGRVRTALARNPDSRWTLRTPENLAYHFMASGLLSHLEDPNGNRLTLTRDPQDRLTRVADPGGRTLELAYDAAGRLATVHGPPQAAGQPRATVTYAYDDRGDLVSVTDPVGGRWTYRSFGHRLVWAIDPDHQGADPPVYHVRNAYDRRGRILEQTDAEGRVTRLDYETRDGQGNTPGVTQVTDPDGKRTHYFTDAMAVTTDVWDHTGRVTSYVYDMSHNVREVVDPIGNTWKLEYDGRGNPTELRDPLQAADPARGKVRLTWDGLDRPTSVTDARGNVTTYQYGDGKNRTREETRTAAGQLVRAVARTHDGKGNVLTETVDPGGLSLTTTHTYDPATNLRAGTTDAAGKPWRFEYDPAGRPTATVDPLGNRSETSYSARGLVTEVRDAAGGRTTWEYDGRGNRTRETVLVAAGPPEVVRVHTWTYDGSGRPIRAVDPAGTVTTTAYDPAGRVARTVVDPGAGRLNLTTQYGYDAAGRPTTVTVDPAGLNLVSRTDHDAAGRPWRTTDPRGMVTESRHDAAGRLAATVVDAGAAPRLNQTTTYGYDNDGNQTTVTDALNRTTTTEYDALGRVVRVIDAAGEDTRYRYDAAGRRDQTTDALDRVTTTVFDPNGRPLTVTAPGNRTTTFVYDDAGRRTGAEDPTDRATTTTYDAAGRTATVADPSGRTASTLYNLAGQPRQRTSAAGVVTAYAYDAAGRLETAVVDPGLGRLNLTTRHEYDAAGRLTRTVDPRGNPTAFGYDAAGRQTRITDARDGAIDLAYDPAGRLTEVTNARRQTTTFAHHPLGGVTKTTDPLLRERTAAYDVLGRLVEETDARGVRVTHTYDALDRPDVTSYPAVGGLPAGTVDLDHDALGRRTRMADSTGTTTWTYRPDGQLEAVAGPQGTVAYSWDAAGRRTGLTLPGNRTTTYVYDAAGALDTLTDWQGRPTEFDADGDGKPTEVRRPNGVRTAHGYDAAGRLRGVSHYAPGGAALAEFGYVLDANGNRERLDVTGSAVPNGAETYRYDGLDRLEEVTYANGDRAAYEYDANGNRTKLTTTPAGGQPLVAGYTYDAADQLTSDGSLTYGYDASGNLTSTGTSTFTWDWRGRMASATSGTGTTAHAYDGDGVRTGKTAGGATTPFLWDRAGGLPLLVGDGTQAYLHAAGGVLAGVDGAGAATWTLPDGLGSVRARADGAGAVVGTASYDAFGTPRSTTGVTGTFGFAGEQADPETGQLHLRARQYAPGLGRFLAADPEFPAGPGTQGYGRYAYAGNSPVTLVDPSGRQACAAAGVDPRLRAICIAEQAARIAIKVGIALVVAIGGVLAPPQEQAQTNTAPPVAAPEADPPPRRDPDPVLTDLPTPTAEESNCYSAAQEWDPRNTDEFHIQAGHFAPVRTAGNITGNPQRGRDGYFLPELSNWLFLDGMIGLVFASPSQIRYQPGYDRADCLFTGWDPAGAGPLGYESDWVTESWTLAVAFESSTRRVITAYPCDQRVKGEDGAGYCVEGRQR